VGWSHLRVPGAIASRAGAPALVTNNSYATRARKSAVVFGNDACSFFGSFLHIVLQAGVANVTKILA